MRACQIALLIVVGAALAVSYLWLVAELTESFATLGWPTPRYLEIIGHRYGAITWLEILHTAAVLVAASPVAIASNAAFGRRAWIAVSAISAPAAIFSISIPLHGVSWSQFFAGDPLIETTDCIKLVVIPILLVMAIQHRPSNTRWSGPPANKLPVSVTDGPDGSGLRAAAQLHR